MQQGRAVLRCIAQAPDEQDALFAGFHSHDHVRPHDRLGQGHDANALQQIASSARRPADDLRGSTPQLRHAKPQGLVIELPGGRHVEARVLLGADSLPWVLQFLAVDSRGFQHGGGVELAAFEDRYHAAYVADRKTERKDGGTLHVGFPDWRLMQIFCQVL
ncbi:hypothetical protein D9M71_477080 [compost metagenome]